MSPPIRDGSGNSIGSIRLGDGTEISEVRTGAGDVLFSGNAIPDSVVDNFEDSDANPAGPYGSGETIADYYGGDTGEYSRQPSTVFEGQNALQTSASGTRHNISSTSGLPRYPQQGEEFQVRVYIQADNDPHFIWATSDESADPTGYSVQANPTSGEFNLFRRDPSFTQLDVVSATVPTNEWIRYAVSWASDGSITGELYDASGTLLATVSDTDITYTSGGIGFRSGGFTTDREYYDLVEVTGSI